MGTATYKNKGPGAEADRYHMRIQNRKTALVWLRKNGWKVSQASFYRHIKAGKLPMSSAGTIDADDLRIYASAYLQPTTPPPDCKAVAGLLEVEKQAQIKLLQTREEKLRFEHGLLSGRYVERDKVLLEFSVKLGLIDSVFKTGVRTRVAEWLHEIGADPEQGPALFSLFETEIDRLMDDMANMNTIRVRVRRTKEALSQ